MAKLKIMKYFFLQSNWMNSLDLIAISLSRETSALKFHTVSFIKTLFVQPRNIIQGFDSRGEVAPLYLLVKYDNSEDMESTIYSNSPVGSKVNLDKVKIRIREIDYLISLGHLPPEGSWVYLYKGMLQGKKGVVVGGSGSRVVIRFYDAERSYKLECDVKDCRLLSGHILELPTPSTVELFK